MIPFFPWKDNIILSTDDYTGLYSIIGRTKRTYNFLGNTIHSLVRDYFVKCISHTFHRFRDDYTRVDETTMQRYSLIVKRWCTSNLYHSIRPLKQLYYLTILLLTILSNSYKSVLKTLRWHIMVVTSGNCTKWGFASRQCLHSAKLTTAFLE